MVGGAEGGVVVYCPGQSVGERLQRIVQQPHEGGVCGPGSFRFVTGGQGFGSGIPAVLESGEVAQRDRVQNAGRIRRRTWAGLRYAPSAPSSITKPTDSHKHWYIKRGQASITAVKAYFQDFVQALINASAPMDAIFAYEIWDEYYYYVAKAPLSSTSG